MPRGSFQKTRRGPDRACLTNSTGESVYSEFPRRKPRKVKSWRPTLVEPSAGPLISRADLLRGRSRFKQDGDMKPKSALFCRPASWHGRKAFLLENSLVQLTTLTGGGHIAELRFADAKGLPCLNPLWVPPWPTIEPYNYREETHRAQYGTLTEGKLLSGLAGHNLCLDYFGSPSPEEAKRGLSQHGEAPSARWRKTRIHLGAQYVALTLGVRLPAA